MPKNKINAVEMRKQSEIIHGRKIVDSTEEIWGYKSKAGQLRIEKRARLIINAVKIRPSKKVIEIGCGPGEYTARFIQTKAHITALDISPDLLDINRRNLAGSNLEHRLGNIENMDFEDGSFNAVIGNAVLHHLNINQALKEIRRVLSPGGLLAFAEPNMLNPQIFMVRNIKYLREKFCDSPNETAFIRWVLKKRLNRCGFENISIRPIDFIHPKIPDIFATGFKWLGEIAERMPLIREIAGSLFITARKSL